MLDGSDLMLAISRLLLLTLVLALSPRLAFALAGDWDVNDHVDTRLVAAIDGVGDAAKIQLGLQFKMKKGWKISRPLVIKTKSFFRFRQSSRSRESLFKFARRFAT